MRLPIVFPIIATAILILTGCDNPKRDEARAKALDENDSAVANCDRALDAALVQIPIDSKKLAAPCLIYVLETHRTPPISVVRGTVAVAILLKRNGLQQEHNEIISDLFSTILVLSPRTDLQKEALMIVLNAFNASDGTITPALVRAAAKKDIYRLRRMGDDAIRNIVEEIWEKQKKEKR